MLVLVSGVVTQRDCVVGSRAQVAHDPPLHARALARSSCLGIPRALMAHPHHVRAIRGHTAPGGHMHTQWRHFHLTVVVVTFTASGCLFVTPPTLLIEIRSGRGTYGADEGGSTG